MYVEDVRLCSMLRYHTGSRLAGCADDDNISRAATSRDRVIEKMTITVSYDADIEKARKIIKKIGLELFEDPEFKATIVETLKMQGIDSLGYCGLLMRMKAIARARPAVHVEAIRTADDPSGIQRKWHQDCGLDSTGFGRKGRRRHRCRPACAHNAQRRRWRAPRNRSLVRIQRWPRVI